MSNSYKDLFTRSPHNPVLKPNINNSWESLKVYNCGAVYDTKTYHVFYRAVGTGESWQSSIGHAISADGEKFSRFNEPALAPMGEAEKRGLEDPRISKVDETYYMAHSAYDGITPRLNIATSKNLVAWQKLGPALHNFKFEEAGGEFIVWQKGKPIAKSQPHEWSKSGGIFPEKINGKYWMLFGEYRVWLAVSDNLISWQVLPGIFLGPRPGNHFDNIYVEMGPPPIKTEKGWLVLYHGVDEKIFYRLGYLLLDLKNPEKILFRSNKPIFGPREPYELSGLVDILPGGLNELQKMSKQELGDYLARAEKESFMPKVTFCCGAVVVGDTLRIYYGAGDTVICTATAKLTDILKAP